MPYVPPSSLGSIPDPENPGLPSTSHQIKNAVSTAKNILSETVSDLLRLKNHKIFIENEEYDRRLSICKECDNFRSSDERCGSLDARKNWGCGCYISDHVITTGIKVPGKARFRDAHCPLTPPKW